MTGTTATKPAFDIPAFLARLTTAPGVYRMLDEKDAVLYVGKARNLRKRVSQYFLRQQDSARIAAMVPQIRRIDVTVTHTEDQALVLEANMIKELAPRFNVSLRDDKSYPYLSVSGNHAYPRIGFYRGRRRSPHRYFGPYPSAAAVRDTLSTLQKLFRLRPCTDGFFANRSRPCLQHQIQRCSAPCVGKISAQDYARDVARAETLLQGRGPAVETELDEAMRSAAQQQDFEQAARLRDQLSALRRIQAGQESGARRQDCDYVAMARKGGGLGVCVLSVRDGRNLGHQHFFPKGGGNPTDEESGAQFLAQYYLERKAPAEILVEVLPEDARWLSGWLSAREGRKIAIRKPLRGRHRSLLDMAYNTAAEGLDAHLSAGAAAGKRLQALAALLGLSAIPQRLECFDISHTGGEAAVASCVVFKGAAPAKSEYRRFNLKGLRPGDDYAAIAQAVTRRYGGADAAAPDLVLIDGGPGQVKAAVTALQQVERSTQLVVGISKGSGRRPELDRLHLPGGRDALRIDAASPALLLLQQIRDEAHRFALMGHRGRRSRVRLHSSLEDIEGLGPVRRRQLLQALGGLAQVRRAGAAQLEKVPGISRALAQRIHAHFR